MFRCTQEGFTSRPFYSESALRDHVRSSTTCGEGRARAPPPKCGARLGDAGDMSFGPHKLGKGRCDSPLPPGTACGACHVFVYTDYSYGLPVGAQCAAAPQPGTDRCSAHKDVRVLGEQPFPVGGHAGRYPAVLAESTAAASVAAPAFSVPSSAPAEHAAPAASPPMPFIAAEEQAWSCTLS